jgi:hypothetical protein
VNLKAFDRRSTRSFGVFRDDDLELVVAQAREFRTLNINRPAVQGRSITATMNHSDPAMEKKVLAEEEGPDISVGEVTFNASGHKDQLKRQYGVIALCALALNIDNAWVALGGSVTIAIANGGPPGVLYEVIVACAYYAVVGACIAEVCSDSIPTFVAFFPSSVYQNKVCRYHLSSHPSVCL